jgi:hypothetical protein
MTDISPKRSFTGPGQVTQWSAKWRTGIAYYSANFALTMRRWICHFSRHFRPLIFHRLDATK